MRQIELNENAFRLESAKDKFLILGDEHVIGQLSDEDLEAKVLDKEHKLENIEGLWATLGYANDEKVNWEGKIEISTNTSEGVSELTKAEAEKLKMAHGLSDAEIKTHYLSLNDVRFPLASSFTMDEIPELRMDVMLDPNEGALVFYEGLIDDDNEEDPLYIQPLATPGHKVNERKRLRYQFDIIPKQELIEDPEHAHHYKVDTDSHEMDFLIKVLIFKREVLDKDGQPISDSVAILKEVEQRLLENYKTLDARHKKHELLLFNPEKNNFYEAQQGELRAEYKTLLLIHGTFSSTKGSFKDIYGKDDYLTGLMKEVGYQQILAFDHPTVSYDAVTNSEVLFDMLNDLGIRQFAQAVDLMGTSQGGVIVQYLATLQSSPFKVGKAALVASANGVGYFTVAKGIPVFLKFFAKILKRVGKAEAAMIAQLAQHSAEAFLKQPGMQMMTPGNPALNNIINGDFKFNPSFYPVVGDYSKEALKYLKLWKRALFRIFIGKKDQLPQWILGEYNDLVVGTREQFTIQKDFCAVPSYSPDQYRDYMEDAIHGNLFKVPEVRTQLSTFFDSGVVPQKSKVTELQRFDAHLHLFGRDILTVRVITMLVLELISSAIHKGTDISDEHIALLLNNTRSAQDDQSCKDDDEEDKLQAVKNVLHYALLNKTSDKVIEDLSEEYLNLNSNVYRYIPLMFDIEMTFNEGYRSAASDNTMQSLQNDYLDIIDEVIDRLSKLLKASNNNESNSLIRGLNNAKDALDKAKVILSALQTFRSKEVSLKKDTLSAYEKQVNELTILKKRYGDFIYPFLAVDPRRDNGAVIPDLVGADKIFKGIKIYTPNGYSPLDFYLFSPDSTFVAGQSLYAWCEENDIPIMAHNSDAGFATFCPKITINGKIYSDDGNPDQYYHHRELSFENTIPFPLDKFQAGVQERGLMLNHPVLWKEVLDQYPNLRLCLAHFGGASDEWRARIAELILTKVDGQYKYPNLFTDLSCMTKKCRLEDIKAQYFSKEYLRSHIMYGSDFYLSMFQNLTFKKYYNHFDAVFDDEELDRMMIDVPQRYLNL